MTDFGAPERKFHRAETGLVVTEGHVVAGYASLFGKAPKFRTVLRESGIPIANTLSLGDETRDIDLTDLQRASDYFDERFGIENWKFTTNGRHAIEEALKNYNLSSSDIITILTTSQNFYISSCVTKTIEKF